MGTVAIIGASRGIGLELARQYARESWRVHATARDEAGTDALRAIEGEVVAHRLEVTDADQIASLAQALAGETLDVLVHNAGVYGTGMARDAVLTTNVDAPIAVAEALLGRMRRDPPGCMVLMSSQMGARHGGATPRGLYGESKALLNDRFRERAPAWRGVVAIVMHPGWVRTRMGGAGATLSVTESVGPMRETIARLGPDDHGRFLTFDGREHPW